MKYAIITGATQGIGKATAEQFLSNGFSVAICARSSEDLKKTESEWNQKYPEASVLAFQADLGKKEEVTAFATYVLANFAQVDVLVNNAGLYFPGTLSEEADGQLEKMIAVNLYSAYYLTRSLLPTILENGQGAHIFNICSIASLRAYPNGGAYSVSKYALLGFSDNLRLELQPKKVKVTSVCPGATYSRSWEGSGISTERIMQAGDVAAAIWSAYNLSPQANVDTLVIRPTEGDI